MSCEAVCVVRRVGERGRKKNLTDDFCLQTSPNLKICSCQPQAGATAADRTCSAEQASSKACPPVLLVASMRQYVEVADKGMPFQCDGGEQVEDAMLST